MTRILLLTCAALCAALLVSVRSCRSVAEECEWLEGNQRTLLDRATYYRTRDSLSAASVERLTLSKAEIEAHRTKLVETCDALRIKLKRLQSASTTATETNYEFKTVLRDSVVVRDSMVVDTIRCLAYSDAWLTFAACTQDGVSFDAKIESRDTLTTIVHRVPRKFLFFRWGTKAIRQEVVSKNPHTKITYTEYIELKK